ncbi:metal ABC transporter ATP-binding protein [Franconibacter pulveris]|uniref:ABC transporter ATP-binding protein n=1 Tax=Franconibacter pulveris TaxID=435910 RepID=A0A0J8VJZ5_9ENTR|nr:ATP-binding cassette domain-containing protein [Franconibacter pulveris]KMV33788.1 ABC transporter ATP-binding protein [Franconibacter pulveris]KMV36669.1 ABC transporter ATP-binding protein [Franconibacter pulveris]
MITLNNLVTGYAGKRLTCPLNGAFRPGSPTAIVGVNGCGKSTLLKTLAGFLPPLSGSVSWPGDKKIIGWLPQQNELDHDFPLTVSDVVAMGAWPNAALTQGLRGETLSRIDAALEQVGLTALRRHTLNRLSGGQFQRMLFARLLVQDAPIMLMDEPFTGIDSQTSDALLEVMATLNARGKTLLVVLHNQQMVHRHFPETLWLHHGHYRWGQTASVLPPPSACPLPQD